MALKPQLNFSGGELDPILHDRATLERFQNSLKTARNVVIGRSGTVKSRFGTLYFKQAKYENAPIKIFNIPGKNYILEFGFDPAKSDSDTSGTYVRMYDFSGSLVNEFVTSGSNHLYFRKQDVPNLQFVYSAGYVYVFCGSNSDQWILRLNTNSPYDVRSGSQVIPQRLWPFGAVNFIFTSSSTGYDIDYGVTIVIDNQESEAQVALHSGFSNLKKCISTGEKTTITIRIGTGSSVPSNYNEIRIYQRPSEGSAYGYLGRTTNFYSDGTYVYAKFVDVGADPDYGKSFPIEISVENLDSTALTTGTLIPATGTVYQQRLILGNIIGKNNEAIIASRPGYQGNFYRDYPYDGDSSLLFKAGSSGNAKVLRMIESEGLVVFTTNGVYVSEGLLSVDNLSLVRRGAWVIDENIPPLVIPGGLFFVDKTTNSIRQLTYSQEIASYTSINQSIFSDHLFKDKTIKSWSYQEGLVPLLIVVFSDGSFATLTYDLEHKIRAWTRHDYYFPVEYVEGSTLSDTLFLVINNNGARHIVRSVPREVPTSIIETNPEADLIGYGAFMDSMVVQYDLVNNYLTGVNVLTLSPVTVGDWSGQLTLSCGTSGIFTTSGPGDVGNIYRFFNPKDKTRIDLEIISRTNNNTVIVQPTDEFPSEYASGFRLYFTHLIVSSLSHLNGKQVSIICDGDLISSPYNDNSEEEVGSISISGGTLTLSERSAITIVGLPIVADIRTLNITTAEQSPTTIESLNVNKLYMKMFESRGLYISNEYPENSIEEYDGTSVADMQSLDDYVVNSNVGILGNRNKQKITKRYEITIPGSWESNGEISLRQVDPFHFSISIIADVEILARE